MMKLYVKLNYFVAFSARTRITFLDSSCHGSTVRCLITRIHTRICMSLHTNLGVLYMRYLVHTTVVNMSTIFLKLLCLSVLVSSTHKKFLSHFYIVKTVVLPLRNSANMPASRLPAPNSPDFARLAPLLLKSKIGSKKFYELLRPISTHTERPSNFIKILLMLLLVIPMYYVLFNLESITPKAFSAKLNSRRLHYSLRD